MQLFESELANVGAARPSTILGAGEITKIYEVMAEICPFHFVMGRWMERQSQEGLQVCREEMATLDKALERWGF